MALNAAVLVFITSERSVAASKMDVFTFSSGLCFLVIDKPLVK